MTWKTSFICVSVHFPKNSSLQPANVIVCGFWPLNCFPLISPDFNQGHEHHKGSLAPINEVLSGWNTQWATLEEAVTLAAVLCASKIDVWPKETTQNLWPLLENFSHASSTHYSYFLLSVSFPVNVAACDFKDRTSKTCYTRHLSDEWKSRGFLMLVSNIIKHAILMCKLTLYWLIREIAIDQHSCTISFLFPVSINPMVCVSASKSSNAPHPSSPYSLVSVIIAPGLRSSYCGAKPSSGLLCLSVIVYNHSLRHLVSGLETVQVSS